MNPPDNLAAQMAEKTNEQLYAMFETPEDWTQEALELACDEIQRRGLPAPTSELKPQPRQGRGAYSFQGIGTTFYGQRDFRPDGTFITTEWFIIFCIPIFPVRSIRVKYEGPGDPPTFGIGSTQNYSVYERRLPNWKQVLFTYGYVGFLIAWIYSVCTTATSIFPHALDTDFGVAMILIVLAIPFPTPWILRYYARRKSQFKIGNVKTVDALPIKSNGDSKTFHVNGKNVSGVTKGKNAWKTFAGGAAAGVLFCSVLYYVLTRHPTSISTKEAAAHIGQSLTVVGMVSEVHVTSKGTVLIDMDGRFPDEQFTAVWLAPNAPITSLQNLNGRKISVKGVIQEYGGRPEIVLTSLNQITASGDPIQSTQNNHPFQIKPPEPPRPPKPPQPPRAPQPPHFSSGF